jgi:hypothetical protein
VREKRKRFEGQERPADTYIHFIANYKEGKDYIFDVGVTCPTASTYVIQLEILQKPRTMLRIHLRKGKNKALE